MIVVRYNTPETNSSSTHAICIDKESITTHYQHEDGSYSTPYSSWEPMRFRLGKFGWEFKKVDTPSYLWTYINSYVEDADTLKMIRERLRTLLRKYLSKDIKIIFDSRSKGLREYHSYDEGTGSFSKSFDTYFDPYIDHVDSCKRLFDRMFNEDWTIKDEDLLSRYLLGWNSCVFTGNDNECMNPDDVIKTRSTEFTVYFKRN